MMIPVTHIDCLTRTQQATHGLTSTLRQLTMDDVRFVATTVPATSANGLKLAVEAYLKTVTENSVLIVAGHGHESRSGFEVHDEAVRWHDLAFLLRGKMPPSTIFIFYSCNGAYPGISHAIGRESGPAFIFGPVITVPVGIMREATLHILDWYAKGDVTKTSAIAFVDTQNATVAARNAGNAYLASFLRVIWSEGPGGAHPRQPNPFATTIDAPVGPQIPFRNWGGF